MNCFAFTTSRTTWALLPEYFFQSETEYVNSFCIKLFINVVIHDMQFMHKV